MGLFDKKYCDICGEKIGLLGNRKLEDGNLCKDCARKLSPFFSDRRNSTVEEIKQQLAYREENERRLADFRPDSIFGESEKVYVDSAAAKFNLTLYPYHRSRVSTPIFTKTKPRSITRMRRATVRATIPAAMSATMSSM